MSIWMFHIGNFSRLHPHSAENPLPQTVTIWFPRRRFRAMLHCNETAGDHPRRRPKPSSASMPARRCAPTAYGRRAADLARLTALGLPVPPGVALSFDCVADLAAGGPMPTLPPPAPGGLLALRCSPEERAWGGASAILNIGACATERSALLVRRIGAPPRFGLYRRFIPAFAHAVHGLDPEDFERWPPAATRRDRRRRKLRARCSRFFEDETGEPWPQDPAAQLEAAARAMARAWDGALGAHPAPGQGRARGGRARPGRPADWRSASAGASAARATCSRSTAAPAPRPHRRLPPAGAGQRRPPRRPRRPARSTSSAAAGARPRSTWRRAPQARPRARRRLPARIRVENGRVAILDAVAGPPHRPRRRAHRRRPRQRRRHHPRRGPAAHRAAQPDRAPAPADRPRRPARRLRHRPRRQPGRRHRPHRLHRRGRPGRRRPGRGDDPRPPRDQPRGHPRHARGARRADGARRHVQPCRGDRPRPRPALRRRRQRAAPRPGRAAR